VFFHRPAWAVFSVCFSKSRRKLNWPIEIDSFPLVNQRRVLVDYKCNLRKSETRPRLASGTSPFCFLLSGYSSLVRGVSGFARVLLAGKERREYARGHDQRETENSKRDKVCVARVACWKRTEGVCARTRSERDREQQKGQGLRSVAFIGAARSDSHSTIDADRLNKKRLCLLDCQPYTYVWAATDRR
jgi:hypothetical protein